MIPLSIKRMHWFPALLTRSAITGSTFLMKESFKLFCQDAYYLCSFIFVSIIVIVCALYIIDSKEWKRNKN